LVAAEAADAVRRRHEERFLERRGAREQVTGREKRMVENRFSHGLPWIMEPPAWLVRQARSRYDRFVNMTRHKHLKLDQTKIDRAKKLLGAKTEQETIDRALDLVLGEERILKAHRRVRTVGGFDEAR